MAEERVSLRPAIEALMADPRLVELSELQRTGDEVLDVITLNENQHSDILAWMLDAREGHGQGDEILRDLLVSASTVAAGGESGLDGRGTTARFFKDWPPSRIRSTSFGAAFTARERGMSASERVDLFVIDSQNKFILLIENKAGAAHRESQLEQYRSRFGEAVAVNPRLKKFDHVYIALDRKFDGEDVPSKPASSDWLHLGYDWLKTSATRALMHVRRGNAAARLVVSYCNRQTDWDDPQQEKCLQLAADLHQSHPEALKHLISFSRGRVEKAWLTNGGDADANLLFLLQNKTTVALLKEMQGMASVKAAVLTKLTKLPRDNVENKRAWLDMCPTGWERFRSDVWWPVFFNVRFTDAAQAKYNLALCWNADFATTDAEAERLRRCLATVESRFGTHINSRWRRVVLASGASLSELLKQMADLDLKLAKALKELG